MTAACRCVSGRHTEEELIVALARIDHLEGTLWRIAAPRRPDGTYNLSRKACEQIAKSALDDAGRPL